MQISRFNLRLCTAALLAALCALGAAANAAAPDREYERFFIVMINDQRVGFSRETAEIVDQTLVTGSEMVMRIARFDDELRVSVLTEFVETLGGEPISMRSTTDMGGSRTTQAFIWQADTVRHTTITGDRRTVREVNAPDGNWLTPGEVGEYVRARINAGADTVIYSTVDPSTGLDRVLNRMTRTGTQQIEVLDQTLDAVRWTVVQSVMADLEMVNFTDEGGETLRSELPFGGLNMVMVRTDRDEALKDTPAVEVMASTLVRPTGDIESPRTVRHAVYRLSSTVEGQRLPMMPTAGAQRVGRLEDGTLRITVNLDEPIAVDPDQVNTGSYLAPTPAADSTDEAVRALAQRALRNLDPQASDMQKAEAMRRFVFRFITDKQLGVGFASASEVAQNPAGDCTEHAVLLAAMLRAEGIPSRAANGLIFVDQFGAGEQVFGYHMWTQALVEDEGGRTVWMDFDASWPNAMDATHITTSLTDLGEGSMLDSYITIARLLGVLAIEVEQAR
jgi:transglutaminase-like putative cysteine protease